MRKLLVAALAALTLAPAAHAAGGTTTVYVRSFTPNVPQASVVNATPALQQGVVAETALWSDAPVAVIAGTAPVGVPQITVVDCRAGTAGQHYVGVDGVPAGLSCYDQSGGGTPWQVDLSHQLFDLVENPYVNRVAHGTDHKYWQVEVVDPVQFTTWTALAADGSSVPLADFVGPKWYKIDHATGAFDHAMKCKKAEVGTPGGYAYYGLDGVNFFRVDF